MLDINKAPDRPETFFSESTEVRKSEKMQDFFNHWSKEKPQDIPPQFRLPKEVWRFCLRKNKNPDKQEFLDQVTEAGVVLTQAENIKVDQGEKEYKQSVKHWEFLAETVEGYRASGKQCLWGPHTEESIKSSEILKDANIMPHFTVEREREDGTIKLREVTDASRTTEDGASFNDWISDAEASLKYIAIVTLVAMIVQCNIQWMIMADAVSAFKRIPIAVRFIKYFGVKIGKFLFFLDMFNIWRSIKL